MFPRLQPSSAPPDSNVPLSARKQAVASLVGYVPYRYLLEDVAGVVEECLAALAKAKTEEELVRAGRLYQATFTFFSALSEHPQRLKEQIEAELALQGEDPFQFMNPSLGRQRHLSLPTPDQT